MTGRDLKQAVLITLQFYRKNSIKTTWTTFLLRDVRNPYRKHLLTLLAASSTAYYWAILLSHRARQVQVHCFSLNKSDFHLKMHVVFTGVSQVCL